MSDTPARHSGRIIEWDAKKGFGFLHDGTNRIFIHERAFADRTRVPARGDTISFALGSDQTGRTVAQSAVITSNAGKIRGKDFILLLLLLVGPVIALHRLTLQFPPAALIIGSIVASVATYFVYWWDKHQARTDGQRISESTLHLLSLIGGWPGAFIAQRYLRHKTVKLSFRIVYWLIVVAHQYVAWDFVLGWRIANQIKAWAGL